MDMNHCQGPWQRPSLDELLAQRDSLRETIRNLQQGLDDLEAAVAKAEADIPAPKVSER